MAETLPAVSNVEAYRASTDAASLCKEIVVTSAIKIQGRKYIKVEGWQAIAVAHGCVASAREVEEVENGVRAVGEVRRMSDGQIISQAEGFVGRDEATWFGGQMNGHMLPKRADYAIRAMAQTRAISRACRSAFAHVVVMMNAGLSTTPYEEVPPGGFDNEEPRDVTPPSPKVVQPAPDRKPSEEPHDLAEEIAGPSKEDIARREYARIIDDLKAAGTLVAVGDVMQKAGWNGKDIEPGSVFERIAAVSHEASQRLIDNAEKRRAQLRQKPADDDDKIPY